MGEQNLAGKAQNALSSDKGEQITDKGLDQAEQAVGGRVGEKNQDKVDQVRQQADKKVGNE